MSDLLVAYGRWNRVDDAIPPTEHINDPNEEGTESNIKGQFFFRTFLFLF
jgi:hypothetical protein